MKKEPHSCIAENVKIWRESMPKESDDVLIGKITGWNEFKRPLHEHIRIWRTFIRMTKQEAHKRGLKVT